MRILILGGDGMLGHELLASWSGTHEVRVTLRQDRAAYAGFPQFHDANSYTGVDVRSLGRLLDVFSDFVPDAVVNAVGIVKQRPESKDAIQSLEVNALLPHRLAVLCRVAGARLVQISTDCVFSGRDGQYRENAPSDAGDLYGRTKFLGEVHDAPAVTLRTSIVGRELSRKTGLLEWFLAAPGPVRGFRNAIFSGFTTREMARIIERVLARYPETTGLYHVSSDPISKYDLLLLFKQCLRPDVEIMPDDAFACDRSLDSSRFRRDFGYTPPSWPQMVEELQALERA